MNGSDICDRSAQTSGAGADTAPVWLDAARRLAATLLGFLGCAVAAGLSISPLLGATARVDVAEVHQTIRGFGGATVFQPPDLPASLTDAELDALFGTAAGQIGFTILRIRVAADDAWRAIELSHAQRAKARGAIVIATPWSPPAEMKTNNSLVSGSLKPESYAAYARYLNDFAADMAAHGAGLYAISVQNEPDFEVTYESCDWTPDQMLAFCRDHAGAITATRVIAPESFQFRRVMSDPVLNDERALANVAIIGGHIYGGGLADYPLARARGREVWMTEHLDLETTWAASLATGKEIHDCLATANFNAYIWWYLRRYYGPLGEDGAVTKRGYVMAQFARFVRPGAVRVGATANPAAGVYVSAYSRDKVTIVALNLGSSAVDQVFAVAGRTVQSVTPWLTTADVDLARQTPLPLSGNAFTATLPASSITTFVCDIVLPEPAIARQPQGHVVALGHTVVLDVEATGEYVTYQWTHDGTPLETQTGPTLVLSDVDAADAGSYRVTVSNSGGSVTSDAADVTVSSSGQPGRLINLSTRSPVGLGDAVQIGGFVIEGTRPKAVLIRAAGPALLGGSGLAGVLADPILELHDQQSNAIVATNDDWDAELAPVFEQCGAFAWVAGSRDAALLSTLAPGAYTAVVRGQGDSVGLGLVEIYDAERAMQDPVLVNLSARSQVGVNDDVQIAGFVIEGETSQAVLIRASGPAVAKASGLSDTLVDPAIELRDQVSGQLLATADDWDPALEPVFDSVGAFRWTEGSADAALLVSLPPGHYTAIVRGKSGTTGLALVEVYGVP